MIKKILYCTTSVYLSKTANYIQVNNMISAFENKNIEVYSIFKVIKKFKHKKARLHLIESSEAKISHYIYLLKASWKSITISNKKKCDIIYTRSITIAFICQIFGKIPVAVELHGPFSSKLEILFAKFLAKKKILFFCITKPLIKYIKLHVKNCECIHAPDAHSSKIVKLSNLENYYTNWSSKYKPKVGYFGLLNNQKGQKIIEGLLKYCDYARFYIYTLNSFKNNSPNLFGSGNLSYDKSLIKMNEMDFLLLTIVPQKTPRDISSFTSPLKLYEYSATGKVIIASNIPVLKEELGNEKVFFSENTVVDFCNSIKMLSKSNVIRKRISRAEIQLARQSTWAVRADLIIKSLSNVSY